MLARKGVSMVPGDTAFTLIGASSSAKARVKNFEGAIHRSNNCDAGSRANAKIA